MLPRIRMLILQAQSFEPDELLQLLAPDLLGLLRILSGRYLNLHGGQGW